MFVLSKMTSISLLANLPQKRHYKLSSFFGFMKLRWPTGWMFKAYYVTRNIQLWQASIVSHSIAVSHKGSNLFLFFVEKKSLIYEKNSFTDGSYAFEKLSV